MTQPQGTFTVRWGKLSLAALGALATLAAPITLVVALVGPLSLWVPLIALAVAGLSVAGLRASAVRDRRRKAWEQAAVSVPAALIESAAQDAAAREARERAERELAEARLAEERAAELERRLAERQDAPFDMLAEEPADEAVGEDEPAVLAPAVAAAASEQWTPRELPAPSYVGATPAQRPAAAPLPREESKRAEVITSIRQAEAQRLEAERSQRAERLDLDAVLQRRRA
mgnify:CR=1 FL=1